MKVCTVSDRSEIIQKIRKEYPYLERKFRVKRIGLFGSTARDVSTDESDIDLVVEFHGPVGIRFVDLVDHLESLLGRKVEVLTKEGIRNIRIHSVSSDIERDIVYV